MEFLRDLDNSQQFLEALKKSPEFARSLVNSREFVTFVTFLVAKFGSREFSGNLVNFKITSTSCRLPRNLWNSREYIVQINAKECKVFPKNSRNKIFGISQFF